MNVKGVLTLGELPSKEVMKRNGDIGHVNEDYVIEDGKGTSTIHIWDDLIKTLKNGKSYHVKNLSIKNCSGNTLQGTTSTTLFEEGDVTVSLDKIKAPELLANAEKTISVTEFKFVDKLNIYIICQIKTYNKKMPQMPGKNIVQCPHCGASQIVKNATKNITARLCADLDGQEVWFTAFIDTIEAFLSKKNLTKAAKSDEISETLLDLKDISFTYDSTSNFITKVAE